MSTVPVHVKDPAANVLYGWDWSPLLTQGDVILSSTWSAEPAGLTLTVGTHDDTFTSVFASAGVLGERYCLVNHIVTELGRVDERSKVIVVRNR